MPRIVILFLLTLVSTLACAAEEFQLEDAWGRVHRLSDYRGKWVVVNYWASWCPPCVEELPELVTFHDAHRGHDAVVLGINWESAEPEAMRNFAENNLIDYPILMGGGLSKAPLGRVRGLPTTYVVSPEGEIVAERMGPVDREMLEGIISGKTVAKGE